MTALSLHRWTALPLVVFLVLHFATHLSGLWGIEVYNATQHLLRHVYRNPVVEPLLLLAVICQIGLGTRLLVRRFRRGRMARWIEGLDTNFHWPASVMQGSPFLWYFAPYYFAGVTALFVHLGCAVRLMLLRRGLNRHAATGFWCLAIPGGGIAMVINLMLLGAFYEIVLPAPWTDYQQTFVPG